MCATSGGLLFRRTGRDTMEYVKIAKVSEQEEYVRFRVAQYPSQYYLS